MLFEIRHNTQYRYSQPVTFGPHSLRFRPRVDGSQWLESFEMTIDPEPDGLSHSLDAEGNAFTLAWFNGLCDQLNISVHTRVETQRINPFDYLLEQPLPSVPCSYPESLKWLLAPARHRPIHNGSNDPVYLFADRLRNRSNDVLAFLNQLNSTLYREFEFMHRDFGNPHPPEVTLTTRRGACRDLAVLFIDACRAMGLAARFVSGYQEGDPNQAEHNLHAWAEVYLPGAGWRGYDPTHGLAVSDRHVVITAVTDPGLSTPVIGTFRGTGVTSTLSVDIAVNVESSTTMQLQRAQ